MSSNVIVSLLIFIYNCKYVKTDQRRRVMKQKHILFILPILLPVVAFSLTLKESAVAILSSHPKFQESVENFKSIKKEYRISKNGYYPTLDLVGSYGPVTVKSPATNNRKISSTQDETSLILTQNIFNGFATKYMVKQQKSRLDAAGYKIAESADRLILSLSKSYINLIKQKKLISLSKENVATHRAIFKMIKQRSDSGFGRLSDTKQADSRLALAESNLLAQRNDYTDAVSTFQKLYGAKVGADMLVAPTSTISLPKSFRVIEKNSMQCNPTLRVQEANIRYADARHDGSNSAFYPKVDFELSGTIGHDLSGVDGRVENTSALLKVSYNLYNQGADKLNKEKLAALSLKEKSTLANTKRDLLESVKFSWDNYKATQKRIVLLKKHQFYAKETLEAYQQEFSIGKRNLINVLDAEGEYYTARKALVEAEATLNYARYRLLDNMGILTDYFKPNFAKIYRVQICSYKNLLSSK